MSAEYKFKLAACLFNNSQSYGSHKSGVYLA